MEEADGLLCLSLQQFGLQVESVEQLQNTDFFIACVIQCLNSIDASSNIPAQLPSTMSGKYKLCTTFTSAFQRLGYRGDLNFNVFLYPNLKDIRSLMSFVLQQVPEEEQVEVKHENPLLRKIKGKVRAWAAEEWTPFMEKTPKLRFVIQSVQKTEAMPPELEALWQSYKARAQFSGSPAAIVHGAAVEQARSTLREIKLSQNIVNPPSQVSAATTLPGLADVLDKEGFRLTDTGGAFMHEAMFAHETVVKKGEVTAEEGETDADVDAKRQEEDLEAQRQAELEALRATLAALQQQSSDLTAALALTQTNHQALSLEVEEYRKRVAELKKEGEQKYKNAQLLPEAAANVEKLKAEIAEAQNELATMQKEFNDYKANREEDFNKSKMEQQMKKAKYAEIVARMKQMKEETQNIANELQYKEDLYDYLQEEDTKGVTWISRGVYIKRISDVIDKLKRQKNEITKILRDVRDIESSITLTREQFERIDNQAEELVFNEAKKDNWSKSCYEQLNKIREAYQGLVNTVEEQCSVKNAIRDLEIRVNAAQGRNLTSTMTQLQEDLTKIKAENQALESQAG